MEGASLMSVHEMVTMGSFLKPKPQGHLLTLALDLVEAKRGRRETNTLTSQAACPTCDTLGHWTLRVGLH